MERAILVDTQSLTTVKGMHPGLPVLIIDHHILARDLPENWTFRGVQTGATPWTVLSRVQGTLYPREQPLAAPICRLRAYTCFSQAVSRIVP